MPAKKPIRRSQLISPWGVGQMINFRKDESLMVAGLDLWEEKFRAISELDEFKVTEEDIKLSNNSSPLTSLIKLLQKAQLLGVGKAFSCLFGSN